MKQQYWFEAVEALADDDVWAVGTAQAGNEGFDSGVAMHWNGKTWQQTKTPADAEFSAVAAMPGGGLWAVGTAKGETPFAARWDGKAWTPVPAPPAGSGRTDLFGVDGSADNDVWTVGTTGGTTSTAFAQHWDGAKWTAAKLPVPEGAKQTFLNSVRVVSANEVWAVGTVRLGDGTGRPWMLRFDGTQWTETPGPPAGDHDELAVFSVTAHRSLDGPWAAGWTKDKGSETRRPLLLHWTGGKWETIDPPSTDMLAKGIGPDGQGGVFVTGHTTKYQSGLLHYRDGKFTEQTSPVKGDVVMWWDVEVAPDGKRPWLVGDVKNPRDIRGGAAYWTP